MVRKDAWNDFNFFEFTKARFMAQDVIYPGEGIGYSLQYSCLENPMDRGVWRATIHGIAKSWTRLSHYA